ncbi:MAG: AtpZ/AtpI family protein [Bacteroidetes bacterium]|nr:AtpZ/AtpI family protein [Bacteroidota bacterium]
MENKNNESYNERKQIYQSVGPFLNLGLQMSITIGVFVLGGWWLDKQFDTSPIWTLILSGIGIFGAFYSFIRKVINLEKKKKDE